MIHNPCFDLVQLHERFFLMFSISINVESCPVKPKYASNYYLRFLFTSLHTGKEARKAEPRFAPPEPLLLSGDRFTAYLALPLW